MREYVLYNMNVGVRTIRTYYRYADNGVRTINSCSLRHTETFLTLGSQILA